MTALPQVVETVTVSKPVDGTKKRKVRSDKGKPRSPKRPDLLTHVALDKRILIEVKRLLAGDNHYTRYEIVSETEAIVR